MSVCVAFGPLAYVLEGVTAAELPPVLAGYVVGEAPAGARHVAVCLIDTLETAPEGATEGNGFRLAADEVVWALRHGARWPGRGLLAALSELVCRDAPSVDTVAVHAAALRVGNTLALVMAPPGTGKTTLARAARAACVAHNAVLVGAAGLWPLPFAGDPEAGLDAPGGPFAGPGVLVELVRGPSVSEGAAGVFEWLPRGAATTLAVRACARPRGPDPFASQRAVLALAFLAPVPGARLRVLRPEGAWQVLQSVLSAWESR